MPRTTPRILVALAIAALSLPAPLRATDVDGPNDCDRTPRDFGDAPETIQAYPGVPAMFPTCLAAGPVAVRDVVCAPISTAPGPAGFVTHQSPAGVPPYWLGCSTVAPMGIDSEADGKTNDTGLALSACNDLAVDCVEAAFGMSFGQDECYGSNDAGVVSPLTFTACTPGTVTFATSNCGNDRVVYLNVLIDMNEDGDWNDNFLCATQCAYEWAVKNVAITIPAQCGSITSPAFLVGPRVGHGSGWMRVTIADGPVADDFPWNGSVSAQNQTLRGGETEDYPVTIQEPTPPCPEYDDFGDAPEEVDAYPGGIVGHFPTCTFGAPAGGQETVCPPISAPPGAAAGYVKHVALPGDPFSFWLGCAVPGPSVDAEGDGKMNAAGLGASVCAPAIAVDCAEPAWGGAITFGQDECYGDADASLATAPIFGTCRSETLRVEAYNCGATTMQAYLNVLVDWNGDGDWNDNMQCGPAGTCAYEWAVKNQPVGLPPGCSKQQAVLLSGPVAGNAWMRVTITASPVPDDFPWAGSAGIAGGTFRGGETEDYPVTIEDQGDPCLQGYTDFGDAPENLVAYSSGQLGRFPTCIIATPPGTQEIECGFPLSTLPGPTGYVQHTVPATAPVKVWLGCGTAADPGLGRDSESNGKVNTDPPFGQVSVCGTGVLVDCFEPAWFLYGQDECYGTPDACLAAPMSFRSCSDTLMEFTAFNCGPDSVDVRINVLVDWNGDGDWNDVVKCVKVGFCRPEWTIKNRIYRIGPGCNVLKVPVRAGERQGEAWMRITLTLGPVADDFPWNGSLGEPAGTYFSGETEDYPVRIGPSYVDVEPGVPSDLGFAPLTPNPSRNGVLARIMLPREGDVSVVAYDVTGRAVRVLARGWMPAGEQRLAWDFRDDQGRTVPAGLYLVKLRLGADELTRRVIRLN